MKNTKHIAISMTQEQHNRANNLAKRLKMPVSRIVNILINLTDDNQVLQDLIKKLDSLPAECTTEETHTTIYRLAKIFDEALYKIGEEIKTKLRYELDPKYKEDRDRLEKTIKIAKTKWVDADKGEYYD